MTAQLIALSLGWGVQSWTLAAMSALGELPKVDYAIHSDTTWEREQTYTFAEQWTPWLEEHGVKVVTVRGKRSHEIVHQSSKSDGRYLLIPAFTLGEETGNRGTLRRQCTGDWKIDPQDKYVNALLRELKIKKAPGVVEKWLGISQDEWQRAKHSQVPHITHRYPLLDMKMSRAGCINWLRDHNLPVPPKSACVFCPFHSRKAWQELKREGGTDWQIALEVDETIRNVRGSDQTYTTAGVQLFVHAARLPLAQAVQIPEDHGMEQPDMFASVEDDELASCDSGHCFL